MEAAAPRRWVRPLSVAVLAVSLLSLAAGEAVLNTQLGECSYKARTGLPCMGCGGTHALARMAHGDLSGAVAANPLGAFVGLAAWLLVLASGASAVSGRGSVLRVVFAAVAFASPVAFLWNAVSWWLSLP